MVRTLKWLFALASLSAAGEIVIGEPVSSTNAPWCGV